MRRSRTSRRSRAARSGAEARTRRPRRRSHRVRTMFVLRSRLPARGAWRLHPTAISRTRHRAWTPDTRLTRVRPRSGREPRHRRSRLVRGGMSALAAILHEPPSMRESRRPLPAAGRLTFVGRCARVTGASALYAAKRRKITTAFWPPNPNPLTIDRVHLRPARDVRHVVEVALGVRRVEVRGRRDDAIPDPAEGGQRGRDARPADQVPDHRLGRRDRPRVGRRPYADLDGPCLGHVVERRRGPVGHDPVDVVGRHASDRACALHRPRLPRPVGSGAEMWNASAVSAPPTISHRVGAPRSARGRRLDHARRPHPRPARNRRG